MPKIPVLTGSKGKHVNENLLKWGQQFQLSLQECFYKRACEQRGYNTFDEFSEVGKELVR